MKTYAVEYSRLQNIIDNKGTPKAEKEKAALALRNLWKSVGEGRDYTTPRKVEYKNAGASRGGGKRRKKSKRRKSKKRRSKKRKSKRKS